MFLGTNFGHGSSVAVVDNEGSLVLAIEEERLNGIKNTEAYHEKGLEIVKAEYGTVLTHYEGWNIWKRLYIKGIFHTLRFGFRDSDYINFRFFREIKRLTSFQWLKAQKHVGHHLAHAYSLLPCGLPSNSLVLISDALGESNSTSTYFWTGRRMELIRYSPYPNSLGGMFHQLAYHIGFTGRQGPGKLMALSGYGKPVWLKTLKKFVKVDNGRVHFKNYPIWKIRNAWMHFAERVLNEQDPTEKALKQAILESDGDYEKAKDLAASMQKLFEEITFSLILHGIEIVKNQGRNISAVGLSGGAALNCQANGYILKQLTKKNIKMIVTPWSDDAGTAVGAAYYGYHKARVPSEIIEIMPVNPFLSNSFKAIQEVKISNKQILEVAQLLHQGKVIALCSGKMEFGPRALGGRCIIAKPTVINRDRLNAMKKRHLFMPLAPVVLKEDYSRFFKGSGSKYMQWTVQAKQEVIPLIEGAVHVTEESRAQVVENEPLLLSKILKAYRTLEGNSVLLLTSLNDRNKPICYEIEDAKCTARSLGCDAFVSDCEMITL